jgi:hypothetical protein
MRTKEKYQVAVKSCSFGEAVRVTSGGILARANFLTAPEAEEFGIALIVAASEVRALSVRPETRLLPFVEPCELKACSG